MQRGFFVAGNANQMAQNKLNDISHNLANANTVGFMAHRTAFSTVFTAANQGSSSPEQTPAGYLSLNRQFTDTGKGIMSYTKNQFDFAIQGDAFFQVKTEDGKDALTRAGNFTMDGSGKLMTQSG
ncbi:MAG: flagellar hook-basal body complex protein, partial [Mariprofundaceae bacterium]